ncbi:hypothetical protein H5410_056703 [Solanum commersonii]|uniref:Alpha/beta hydrolase fold-3 domain-containing protein n=1 Tax=Solanum commersonii TaxID=4109 RepID=A0A9J5WKY6_SOLCO|nr:hypothetical protein H5410_056703 [Solanum commersonii]
MAYNRRRKKGGFQYICDSVKEGRFPQLTTIGTLQSLSVPGYSAICKMCRVPGTLQYAGYPSQESQHEVPSIVVSLDYGLAPENKLPSQYHDTIDAVLWIKNQALDRVNGEEWLREYGDFSRCYLYGVSCGGNIAFNSALMVLVVVGHIEPTFIWWKNEDKIRNEISYRSIFPLPVIDVLWDFALPKGTDRDMFFPIGRDLHHQILHLPLPGTKLKCLKGHYLVDQIHSSHGRKLQINPMLQMEWRKRDRIVWEFENEIKFEDKKEKESDIKGYFLVA